MAASPATPAPLAPAVPARVAWGLLLFHLVLSPLLFWTGTVEVFEENKAALLALTAVLLSALGLSAAAGRIALGPLQSRLAAAARLLRRDPVLLGAWLYTLSAVVSSAASVSPGTSWRGAEE